MKAINSNSLFFKSNRQLIKESQKASATSGASASASSGQQPSTAPAVPATAAGATQGQPKPNTSTPTSGTPQQAQGAQAGEKTQADLYYEKLLNTENQVRKNLGLPLYKSVREMLDARKKLKAEYEAAKKHYIEKNYMTEQQFKEVYPTVYDFEADQKRGAHNILERSFGDDAILNAIISNNEDVLSKVNPHEISRVMSDFAKRLPSIQRNEDMESYQYRLKLALAPYEFKYPEVKEYFITVKMRQAAGRAASRSSAARSKAQDERVIQDSRSLQERTPIRVTRYDR